MATKSVLGILNIKITVLNPNIAHFLIYVFLLDSLDLEIISTFKITLY